jgi:hypothetical protein
MSVSYTVSRNLPHNRLFRYRCITPRLLPQIQIAQEKASHLGGCMAQVSPLPLSPPLRPPSLSPAEQPLANAQRYLVEAVRCYEAPGEHCPLHDTTPSSILSLARPGLLRIGKRGGQRPRMASPRPSPWSLAALHPGQRGARSALP